MWSVLSMLVWFVALNVNHEASSALFSVVTICLYFFGSIEFCAVHGASFFAMQSLHEYLRKKRISSFVIHHLIGVGFCLFLIKYPVNEPLTAFTLMEITTFMLNLRQMLLPRNYPWMWDYEVILGTVWLSTRIGIAMPILISFYWNRVLTGEFCLWEQIVGGLLLGGILILHGRWGLQICQKFFSHQR
jgi:hypothetical protein